MTDGTQRQPSPDQRRESEERFRQVFDHAVIGMALVAPDRSWMRMNQALRDLLGYTEDELLATTFEGITHPDDLAHTVATRGELLDGARSTLQLEKRYRHKQGHYIWTLVSVALVRDASGQPVHFVTQILDVTKRRHAEQALRDSEEQLRQSQKMEAVGRLAGGIAHDFNNLLTAIASNSDLALADLPADHPVREEIEEIRRAATRASALTKQLLAFSRKQVLRPKVLRLNDIVLDAERMLRRIVTENVSLVTALEPDLGFVRADPGQLAQVLVNLVVNARDAMPDGGLVTLGTANVEVGAAVGSDADELPPGPYVTVFVSDSGTGMDADTRARIFEPFFTTKGPGKGTGLGLSTVYGIVKQSGGAIQVESIPGGGSTFSIYLPRVTEAPDEVTRKSGSFPVLPAAGETVLVVEDEAIVRDIACRILERQGYRVLEAEHGRAALLLSDQCAEPIDLVLTDVVMPEMGGRELAEHLRARRPQLKVLFMSGYTEHVVTRHGVMLAGAGFIAKPFAGGTLARQVRALLDEAPPYSVSA
jgi:PAS domain S-box-containing protein